MNQWEFKHFSIADLTPSSWFSHPEDSSVWVTAYRICRVPQEQLASYLHPKSINFTQVQAILMYGSLSYLDASEMKIELEEDKLTFITPKPQMQRAPEDSYLILLAPFMVDGKEGNEGLTRQNISITVGLLAAFNGRNMVYEHLFDNIIAISKPEQTVISPFQENPLSFPQPDITDTRLKAISDAYTTITNLPEQEKNRVLLSLRWFKAALYENGVDAFLKYWIALEALGMPGTTNIRPLNEALARAYNTTPEKAGDRFKVGRLCSLRGRIVHDGEIKPIEGRLLAYTGAIYTDILLEHLGTTCERRADTLRNDPEFSTWIP